MSKIVNLDEIMKKQLEQKKQQEHEEMLRGLAGLAAYSSGATCMPQGYAYPQVKDNEVQEKQSKNYK